MNVFERSWTTAKTSFSVIRQDTESGIVPQGFSQQLLANAYCHR
jgi:hypothetical protein